MDSWLNEFTKAINTKNVTSLIWLFRFPELDGSLPQGVLQVKEIIESQSISTISSLINSRLTEDYSKYVRLVEGYFKFIDNALPETIELVLSGYNNAFDAFLIPLAKHIYSFAVKFIFKNGKKNLSHICVHIDALRNKMQDRLPFPNTKKVGMIFMLNFTFKCYYELDMLSQMKKVVDFVFMHVFQSSDPDDVFKFCESYYSKSERVEFYFYMGRFLLVQHNVLQSCFYLERALKQCYDGSFRNKRLILVYYLACKIVLGEMVKGVREGNEFKFPILEQFNLTQFHSIILAVQQGNIGLFNEILDNDEFFVKYSIYNVLKWRCPLTIYRNLMKRVFVLGSYLGKSDTSGYQDLTIGMSVDSSQRKTPPHIGFKSAATALRFVQDEMFIFSYDEENDEELESDLNKNYGWSKDESKLYMPLTGLFSRLIDAGFIRGNLMISNACVVVSRKDPFPSIPNVIRNLMDAEQWWLPKAQDRKIIEDDD